MKFTVILLIALVAFQGYAQNQGADVDPWDAQWWDAANDSGNFAAPSMSLGDGSQEVASSTACAEGEARFDGTYYINNEWRNVSSCWNVADSQACFDNLGLLDDQGFTKSTDGHEFGDLVSVCQVRDVNGQKVYDFLISYAADYVHDDNCTEHEVNFIEVNGVNSGDEDDSRIRVPVPPATTQVWAANGGHPNDVWWYSSSTRQIMFSVDHDDLEDQWKCDYQETQQDGADVYQWTCDIELNIFFAGEVQFTYEFQMVSTLDRTITDSLVVAVERNVVTGECCVNELQIEGSLHFCSNLNCTDADDRSAYYLETSGDWPSGTKTVERRERFWVAHRIDTAEFQHYYLQPISIKIGPFVPKVHTWLNDEQSTSVGGTGNAYTNLLIYELESFVALDELEIVSIAKLDDQDAEAAGIYTNTDNFANLPGFTARRRLQDSVGDDYRIKASESMTVGNVEESNNNTTKNNNNASILVLGSAMLVLALLF